MEAKQAKVTRIFMPRTMGIFVLLIIILSLIAGAIKREMALTLTGTIFLAIWLYCLVMTLLLPLFHSRRAKIISIRISPQKIVTGEWTQAVYSEDTTPKKHFLFSSAIGLPGILVRCRLILKTKDGRCVTHDLKPEIKSGIESPETFRVNKRGAYYSLFDEFAVFDILGFFRFAFRIPTEREPLLVSPHAANESVHTGAKGGETNRYDPSSLERTDYLIDHRPYVPGDDPRRINWKLYGHSSELIIRQGEREPPPCSSLTILIDTQFDGLYSGKSAAREAVDLLCENALAIINNADKEMDIQIGYTGQTETSGNLLTQAELGFFLAYPAATDASQAADFPSVPEERGILILALPRTFGGGNYSKKTSHTLINSARTGEGVIGEKLKQRRPNNMFTLQKKLQAAGTETRRHGEDLGFALDRFLSKNSNRSIEIIFIYEVEKSRAYQERMEAAQACAAYYNKFPGVRAQVIGVEK